MFDRFTDQSIRCIHASRFEASQTGSHYVEIEHLLLGIILICKQNGNDFLSRYLSEGITLEILKKKVLDSIPSAPMARGDLALSSHCKAILCLMGDLSDELEQSVISLEYYLYGILKYSENPKLRQTELNTGRILNECGITLEVVKEYIVTGG